MGVQQSLNCCKGDLQDGSGPGFSLHANLSSLGRSCRRSHRTSYRSYLSHDDLNPDLSAYSGIMAHIMNSNKKKKGKKKKGNSGTLMDLPGITIISPGGTSREHEVDINSNAVKFDDVFVPNDRCRKENGNDILGADTPDSLRANPPSTGSQNSAGNENVTGSTSKNDNPSSFQLKSANSDRFKEWVEQLITWPQQDETLLGYEEREGNTCTTPEEMPSNGRDLKLHKDRHNQSLCSPCGYLAPSSTNSLYEMFEAEEGEEEQGVVEELRRNFQSCITEFAKEKVMVDGLSGQSWTYTEFGSDVQKVTDGLNRAGVGPGERLVLIGPNSPQAVLTILATMALGATLVLMSHTDPPEVLLSKMRKVKPTIVVTATYCHSPVLWAAGCCPSVKRAYEIGGLSGKCYPFSRLLDDHGGIPSEVPKTRYDDVALVVFSYDLNDKGYLRKFTYGSILRRLQSTRDCTDLRYTSGHHVVLLALPLAEPYTLMNLLLTGLVLGHSFVTLQHWESRKTLKICQQYKVTYLPLSSLWYLYIIKLASIRKATNLPEVILIYGSVSAIDLNQISTLQMLGAKHVFIAYGVAETLGAIAFGNMTTSSRLTLRKLKNMEIKIIRLDSSGEEADESEIGQIYVMCEDVTSIVSTFRDKKRNKKAEGAEWLATGDVGFMDAEERLHILGHETDKFFHGEEELWLCGVEHVLRRHPAISDAAILNMENQVTAIVSLRPGFSDVTAADVTKYVAASQPSGDSSMNIERVEFSAIIPRSGNGRVMRETLRDEVAQIISCSVPWVTV